MSKGFLTPTRDGTLLNLRVSPGAKRTPIEGPYGERVLKRKVAARPTDGRANAEIEHFLAELLGIPRSTVVRGSSRKDKVVLARSLDHAQAQNALLTCLP